MYYRHMADHNLYANLPVLPEAVERLEPLLERPGLRIERIISTGQSSPPGFWYDQTQAEWVALLTGRATLRFADGDQDETLQLRPGDYVYISPHRRHRVEATDDQVASVWLVFYFDERMNP
jgi:cupin 2 domain-containing protein